MTDSIAKHEAQSELHDDTPPEIVGQKIVRYEGENTHEEAERVIEDFMAGSGNDRSWVNRLKCLPNRIKAEIVTHPKGKKLLLVLLFDAALSGGTSGGQLKAYGLLLNAGKEATLEPGRMRLTAQRGDQKIEVVAGGSDED